MFKLIKWLSVVSLACFYFIRWCISNQNRSGAGCGSSWPLCNGQLFPNVLQELIIEYSHRLVSSIIGVTVLLLAVFAWNHGHSEKFYLSFLHFLVLQGLVLQLLLGAV